MSHPLGRMCLIANPRAGNGGVGTNLPGLLAALDARGLEHEVVETEGPSHAGVAAREALERGCRYLVAVGGDGTVHEVLNGMFADVDLDPDAAAGELAPEPRALVPEAVLGVAAWGSGGDFARTFGLDRKPEILVRRLADDRIHPVDVGVATFLDRRGRPARRLFANIAEVGWGADVVRRVERYPRFLGRVRYLLGAYASILGGTRQETEVTVAAGRVPLPLVNLVVANGQFFGGGMKVAPRALPDDGKLNVLAFTGPRSQVFTMTIRIYRGEHLPDPQISEWQSPTVEVAPAVALPVEADGEYLGTTPAAFRLLDTALRLKS